MLLNLNRTDSFCCFKNYTAFSCSIGQYRCLNGQCISGSSVCDGSDSCGDNSDESQCGTSE